MEATQIEDQIERAVDVGLSETGNVGSAQVDVETSSPGLAPRAVRREASQVDASHGPAMRRHVDAAVAGPASQIEGTADTQLAFALDHLDQLRRWSGMVPRGATQAVRDLEEQPP
jgi:hypothetical protein